MRVEDRTCLGGRRACGLLLEERRPCLPRRLDRSSGALLLAGLDELFEERRTVVGEGPRIGVLGGGLRDRGELLERELLLPFAGTREAGRKDGRSRRSVRQVGV